jgi:hypothetical protein
MAEMAKRVKTMSNKPRVVRAPRPPKEAASERIEKPRAIDFDAMPGEEIIDLAKRFVAYLIGEAQPLAQKMADILAAAEIFPMRGPSRPPIQLSELSPAQMLNEIMERGEEEQRGFFQALAAYGRDKKQFSDEARAHWNARRALLMLVAYNAMDVDCRNKVHRLITTAGPGGAADPRRQTMAQGNTKESDRRPGDPVPREELYPIGSQLKSTTKKMSRANGDGRHGSDSEGF